MLGRIQIFGARYGKKRQACRGNLDEGEGELLRLQVTDGLTCLHYQLSDARQRITFDFVGDHISLMREAKSADVTPLRYEQIGDDDVLLFVGEPTNERQFRARSLWHLWLVDPELCERELKPVLHLMRPNWTFRDQVARIERELFEDHDAQVDGRRRAEYQELIDQLGDHRYQKRQRAYDQLRANGVEVLAFLESLDLRSLDAEQRLRVKKLRQGVRFQRGDNADRVACWMRDDRSVWFRYLGSESAEQRRIAHRQLCCLCGQQLEFDPQGDDGARSEQLTRLAARIALH
ncbi:MAG: hypothetical protein QGG36_15130 [Pirellulaceae bacterium]|nr:hypothetical protein [Pirellulaceae bacterium]MDP7017138.1 hypothetical protein [Pirellulaceae bacterium]